MASRCASTARQAPSWCARNSVAAIGAGMCGWHGVARSWLGPLRNVVRRGQSLSALSLRTSRPRGAGPGCRLGIRDWRRVRYLRTLQPLAARSLAEAVRAAPGGSRRTLTWLEQCCRYADTACRDLHTLSARTAAAHALRGMGARTVISPALFQRLAQAVLLQAAGCCTRHHSGNRKKQFCNINMIFWRSRILTRFWDRAAGGSALAIQPWGKIT